MKHTFSLSVAQPCLEKWEHFTPNSQGGFCHSCHKTVMDFTKMSDKEIINFFNTHAGGSCGRFRPDQLRTYSTKTDSTPRSGRTFLQAGFLGVLLFLAGKQGYTKSIAEKTATHFVQSQDGNASKEVSGKPEKTIKGTVKDEDNQPIPGVTVYLKGTDKGTVTDEAGNFTFPQELAAGDVLIFSFIGFETKEYVVGKDASTVIEIALVTLELELMGEVTVDTPYTGKTTGIRKWRQQIKSLF